jgi:peptidyl-prolyl cis-trans isomerase A (cyclophilin A)
MKAILKSSWTHFVLASIVSVVASPAAFAVDVRLCTTYGAVDIAIDDRAAPRHAANFLGYVNSGFYDGTILHRIVPGSMVQGGRFDVGLVERTPNGPIANESNNGLANRRGTIAAARSDDPNSATSQFFFNLADNPHLDSNNGVPGYSVFGRVTAGMETLDAIAQLPVQRIGNLNDLPNPLVEIQSAATLDRSPLFGVSIEADPTSLAADFDAARARGDAAGTLDALDAMKRSCASLTPTQIVAGAEAAVTLGQLDRARYLLEPYVQKATALDPTRPAAERLLQSLPVSEQSRNVDEIVGHCRRPVAPSIPNGRFTELATLQQVEGAVLRYRQLSQLYLTCVMQAMQRADLDEAETIAVTERHNEMVIELTAVSVRFNQAVRDFRSAREPGFTTNQEGGV